MNLSDLYEVRGRNETNETDGMEALRRLPNEIQDDIFLFLSDEPWHALTLCGRPHAVYGRLAAEWQRRQNGARVYLNCRHGSSFSMWTCPSDRKTRLSMFRHDHLVEHREWDENMQLRLTTFCYSPPYVMDCPCMPWL